MSEKLAFSVLAATLLVASGIVLSLQQTEKSVVADKSETRLEIQKAETPAGPTLPQKHRIGVCFAEGTPWDYINSVESQVEFPSSLALPADPNDPSPHYTFSDFDRWGGGQGNPITLTWSLMPDGLNIPSGGITGETAGPNEMFSRMDSLFAGQGGRATWINRIVQSFDRWHQLTGITYTRIQFNGTDWDDGASFGTNGSPGLRGDIRIGMKPIDGNSNVLAYTFFPSHGDMVFDRAESWGSTANANRLFRNTFMHEHGHGLGFNHVCPDNGLILMEPFLNTGWDGIQHDDIRAGQRAYGDIYENNDTPATAKNLGVIVQGSPITGTCTAPNPTNGTATTNATTCSIDGNGDLDFYKLTATASVTASITVTPRGSTYFSNVQNQSCTGSNQVNSLAISDLNIQLIAADGVTVIATGASSPAGSPETLSGVPVSGTPGIFYVKIYEGNAPTESQLYTLSISVNNTGADLGPPQPNPMTFEEPPLGISTSAISMTATTATDATPPIEYQFDFVVGGSGGGPDSAFQTAGVFIDSGLNPNSSYTYRVRSRDSATPSINTGSYSDQVSGYTLIQTPTGIDFGTVTDNSIVVQAAGTLSFVTSLQSGVYFDSLTPGGDEGLNEWVQMNPPVSATAINLQPNTLYEFRAKARNRAAQETVFGPSGSKATLALAPAEPTLSNATASTVDINVDPAPNPAHTELAILCTNSVPSDANWQGKYVDASGNPQATETWQNDAQWGVLTVQGLQSETQYTFAVKARNLDGVETVFGASASLSTGTSTSNDCNNNEVDDAIDIANSTSQDCNENSVPDECELAGNDCDEDALLDACDSETSPVITQQPESESVCSGGMVTCNVAATGTPSLTYKWRQGTTPLNDGGNISGSDSPTLTISPATPGDAGNDYNCLVSNTCGGTASNDVSVTVLLSGTGDVNGDTFVDGLDVQGFVDQITAIPPPTAAYCAADMNMDGTVNDGDVSGLVAALLVP